MEDAAFAEKGLREVDTVTLSSPIMTTGLQNHPL